MCSEGLTLERSMQTNTGTASPAQMPVDICQDELEGLPSQLVAKLAAYLRGQFWLDGKGNPCTGHDMPVWGRRAHGWVTPAKPAQ